MFINMPYNLLSPDYMFIIPTTKLILRIAFGILKTNKLNRSILQRYWSLKSIRKEINVFLLHVQTKNVEKNVDNISTAHFHQYV